MSLGVGRSRSRSFENGAVDIFCNNFQEVSYFSSNASSIHTFQPICTKMKVSFSFYIASLLPVGVVGVGDCGCSSCTSSVLGRDADGYPVGSRIDWVMANMGQSEQDACSNGNIDVLSGIHYYAIIIVVA